MKIHIDLSKKQTHFKDLKPGDVFFYEDVSYLKITESRFLSTFFSSKKITINCINLQNYCAAFLKDDCLILN